MGLRSVSTIHLLHMAVGALLSFYAPPPVLSDGTATKRGRPMNGAAAGGQGLIWPESLIFFFAFFGHFWPQARSMARRLKIYDINSSSRTHLHHPELLPWGRISRSSHFDLEVGLTLSRLWVDFGPTFGRLWGDF